MTAEEMLALYGREAEGELDLWRLAVGFLPAGSLTAMAGEVAAGRRAAWGQVSPLLVPEAAVRPSGAKAASGWRQYAALSGEADAEWRLQAPAGEFLPERLVSAPAGEESRGADSAAGGRRLRESVLAMERAALARRAEFAGRQAESFGAVYAEIERRLAIELGAG